ncbi:MAG TPA: HU family DNA-binding protein [Acidimicrobiaceae bacterium]|nr:HU family DNA-binding protein [Acidimicrobiaceae bacterium]HCB36959.1 HU family DNA-binding protein [Acidimicrobiaceae bacterium]
MSNKAELVASVAMRAGCSNAEAEKVLGEAFKYIAENVRRGEKVAWPGFGTFSRSDRSARMGRNPQTGATIPIKASRSIKLSASSVLKKAFSADVR